MRSKNIQQKLFLVIEEFFSLQPWKVVASEDIFGIYLKDKDQLYFASLMGSGGLEYGILFLKGWRGYHSLVALSQADMDTDTMANTNYLLSVSLWQKDRLPSAFSNYYKKYNPSPERIKPHYWITAKEPGKIFTPPKDVEAEVLFLCLKSLVLLIRKRLLKEEVFFKDNRVKIFEVVSEGEEPKITSYYREIENPLDTVSSFKIDKETFELLSSLPRLSNIYNLSAHSGLFSIKERYPCLFCVHDEMNDKILLLCFIYEERLKEESFRLLKGVFLGKNTMRVKGLPREIRTDSRLLYDTFKDILASLKIRVICLEYLPKIEKIIQGLRRFSMGRSSPKLKR